MSSVVILGRGALGTALGELFDVEAQDYRNYYVLEDSHVVDAAGTCDPKHALETLGRATYLVRECAKIRAASLTFFGSVVQEIGVKGTLEYSAAKAGLHGLVRTAAREFAPMRVNCLDLGYMDRGMILKVPARVLQDTIERIPLGRLGTPKDLAAAVRFCIDCEYLTGAIVKVNGGLT